ncbi:hypothetical protein M8U30_19550, partial [Enterobacter asburiae]|nr:hypothetical protein [Enterobacter asburiae]
WKPPAHSPEENMVRQKCSGIRRSYLAPVDFEPTMQSRYIKESDLSHDVWETYSWGELLRSREETFLAMTMSSARLSHPAFIRGNRLPQTDQAIIISS